MSRQVMLDEIEEYEAEKRRAHAENRPLKLRDPREVNAENLGNVDSSLEDKSDSDYKKDVSAKKASEKKAAEEDASVQKAMRDNMQRTDLTTTAILGYQPPSPDRFSPPKTKDEKALADEQHEASVAHNRNFHGAFNKLPVKTNDDGLVLGESANPVIATRSEEVTPNVQREVEHQIPVLDRDKDARPVEARPDYAEPTGNTLEPNREAVVDSDEVELQDVKEDQITDTKKTTAKKTASAKK